LLSTHPDFPTKGEFVDGLSPNITDLVKLHPDLWDIPLVVEVDHLVAVTGIERSRLLYYEKVNYSFSAASNAIYFLKHVPAITQMNIENMVTVEDRGSVAHPECHCKGFV
jgi:hypothetical protein